MSNMSRAAVRIATWNLLHARKIAPVLEGGANKPTELTPVEERANLGEIGQYIRDQLKADVIGLQEIDAYQERSGGHFQVAEIAKVMGVTNPNNFAFLRTVIGTPGVSWRKVRSHEINLNPSDNLPAYGIGLISKIPVKEWHTKALGRSRIGLPLLVASSGGKPEYVYVRDEPRYALAAVLENRVTVAVTHLSFVPLVNFYQLVQVKRWLKKLPGEHILIGDLNMPWNIPVGRWRSLEPKTTYPSWKPSIKFDYILSAEKIDNKVLDSIPASMFSDHLPLVSEIDMAAKVNL